MMMSLYGDNDEDDDNDGIDDYENQEYFVFLL